MKIKEKKNTKKPLREVGCGTVIKAYNYYYMVVDYSIDDGRNRTMIISLDDGSYDLLDGDEIVEVVEKAKLVIG